MSVIPRCSKSVYPAGMNWPRPRQCEREGKVQRTGQWFCRQHDPEKVAEKHDEAHNQFLKRQREQEGIKATAENLAKRLGFGKVHYFSGSTMNKSGYTRDLVVAFSDVEKLVAELEEFRAREDARWKG
jgi:hypothetical protein